MAIKLEVKNLYKVFGEHPQRAFKYIEKGLSKEQILEKTGLSLGVKDASLAIEEGEIFVIMGLSGSGKSTMVRLLNRLIEPTRGQVLIDGVDIARISDAELREVRRKKIAMVFQSFALMPHMTVLDNTAFGMELAGTPAQERQEKALDALRQVEGAYSLIGGGDSVACINKFGLADHMRHSLLRQTAANPLFLRMLADNALSVSPPLGKIRDFVTDLDPEHPGAIDLKKYGARLFIDGARIFALAHGISATNTVQRIKLTAQVMNVSQEDMSASIDAFNFIQLMRLRHQHFEESHGRKADNLVQPDTMNEVERRILKEAFRQCTVFHYQFGQNAEVIEHEMRVYPPNWQKK